METDYPKYATILRGKLCATFHYTSLQERDAHRDSLIEDMSDTDTIEFKELPVFESGESCYVSGDSVDIFTIQGFIKINKYCYAAAMKDGTTTSLHELVKRAKPEVKRNPFGVDETFLAFKGSHARGELKLIAASIQEDDDECYIVITYKNA
jgi:hypothetical protein